MKAMVSACNNVFNSLGGSGRCLSNAEMEQIPKMRRSLVNANKFTVVMLLLILI